jgi:hypothetical protein
MGEEYNFGTEHEPLADAAADERDYPGTRSLVMRNLKQIRVNRRESQATFWARFGVTQSSGSRFETGLGVPPAVAILVKLYISGRLSDGDLVV